MDPRDDDVLGRAPVACVAELDPLVATPRLARLPELNAAADVAGLVAALRALVPDTDLAARMDPFAAAAATRDLGMLLASLRRHGVEPVEAVPEVEAVMLRLAATTGMAPRETVLHYTLWNPVGARERRFTRDPGESGLIDAVRMAAPGIEGAVDGLVAAWDLAPTSAEFAAACGGAAARLAGLAEAMKVVRGRVDPVFFATELRPYFEPVRLGGRRWSGAAAAPLAVGVIDHLLWSSDCDDPQIRGFQDHLNAYGLPGGKRLYAATLGRPSIVTRLAAARADAASEAGARAVDELFKVLLAFRSRHTVIAKAAYAPQIRRYPVGSAGYGVDTLARLLELTKAARRRARGEDGTCTTPS